MVYNREVYDSLHDGGFNDPDGDLYLREMQKETLSREEAVDPMEASFRAVEGHAHNLKNVSDLREKYPLEYMRKMTDSLVKPEGVKDSAWYPQTFAGHILKGIFDANTVDELTQYLEEQGDRLGIPPEFLQLPDIQKYMLTLLERGSGVIPTDVRDYLYTKFPVTKLK